MSKSKKRSPGRPPVYTGNQRKHIVALAKKYGISHTVTILRAENGTPEAALRSANLFPEPVTISQPTVKGYATAAGLTFQKGRPSAAVVEARAKGKATAAIPAESKPKSKKGKAKAKDVVADDDIKVESDADAAMAAVEAEADMPAAENVTV